MTDHERELLLRIAKYIQNIEADCAKETNHDPMANLGFSRRKELIELVEGEAYPRT